MAHSECLGSTDFRAQLLGDGKRDVGQLTYAALMDWKGVPPVDIDSPDRSSAGLPANKCRNSCREQPLLGVAA